MREIVSYDSYSRLFYIKDDDKQAIVEEANDKKYICRILNMAEAIGIGPHNLTLRVSGDSCLPLFVFNDSTITNGYVSNCI